MSAAEPIRHDRQTGRPEFALDIVRAAFPLPQSPLHGVLYRGDDPRNRVYELALDGDRTVLLGTSADLLSPRKVRAVMLAATGKALPPPGMKEIDWAEIAEAVVAAAERAEGAGTEADETREWIADYLRQEDLGFPYEVDLAETQRLAETLVDDAPPLRDPGRRLYLRTVALGAHVHRKLGTRVTARELSDRFGRLGFEPVQLSARLDDRIVKARYWRSPPRWEP